MVTRPWGHPFLDHSAVYILCVNLYERVSPDIDYSKCNLWEMCRLDTPIKPQKTCTRESRQHLPLSQAVKCVASVVPLLVSFLCCEFPWRVQYIEGHCEQGWKKTISQHGRVRAEMHSKTLLVSTVKAVEALGHPSIHSMKGSQCWG